ncbi:MAG TPA: hypothetical protein DIU48_00715 [Acidobacteria bacterium]|nr:hypothetical protein [Acidobacteriota bacterium]
MRDPWYGGDRDVFKWSTLVHLARRESAPAILHVAMYRPAVDPPPLLTAQGHVALPVEVQRHFWNLDNIRDLSEVTGLAIEVYKEPFVHRAAYFNEVCRRIEAMSTPVVVFLDPDIGVESDAVGPAFVASAEVALVFEALRAGDVLVCYQRARRQKDWRGRARRAFANAPGLPSFDVEVLRSELARDVLLLAAKKAP